MNLGDKCPFASEWSMWEPKFQDPKIVPWKSAQVLGWNLDIESEKVGGSKGLHKKMGDKCRK